MKKIGLFALFLVYQTISGGSAAAQSILRVEEDWELQVTQPAETLDAPQITTSMLPFGQSSNVMMQFDLNHATAPNFTPGGMQLRICAGDECISDFRLSEDQRLAYESETVTWTQVLQRTETGLAFGVTNGSSQSWGAFGGNQVVTYAIALPDLSMYRPAHSLEQSGVCYAGNRVASLRLKRVRVYDDTGSVQEYELNWEATQ